MKTYLITFSLILVSRCMLYSQYFGVPDAAIEYLDMYEPLDSLFGPGKLDFQVVEEEYNFFLKKWRLSSKSKFIDVDSLVFMVTSKNGYLDFYKTKRFIWIPSVNNPRSEILDVNRWGPVKKKYWAILNNRIAVNDSISANSEADSISIKSRKEITKVYTGEEYYIQVDCDNEKRFYKNDRWIRSEHYDSEENLVTKVHLKYLN